MARLVASLKDLGNGHIILSLLFLLATANLTGQLSQRYTSQAQLPDGGGNYSITFQAKFAFGTVAGPEGSIMLTKGNRIRLKLTDFRVTGPDPEVAKKIRVRLVLPISAGGSKLNISNSGLDQTSLTIKDSGSFGLYSDVFIIYMDKQIKNEKFNLTRVFNFPTAQVVKEDPVPPPVSDPADTDQTNDGGENGGADPEEISQPHVPKEKQPWVKDFKNSKISPEEFVDIWSKKIDLVEQKRWVVNLIKQKLRLIDLKPSVEEMSNNRYKLTFEYVSDLKLDTITGGTGFKVETDEKVMPYGHQIIISVTDAGSYLLKLLDENKVNGVSIVALDNLLGGELAVGEDSVSFTFQGGVPPYELLFYQKGGLKGQLDIGYDSIRTVSMDKLRAKEGLNLKPGTYTVKLQDQQKSVTWNYSGDPITVSKAVKEPVDTKIPLMVGGGLAILALLLIIRGTKRRGRRAQIRENLSEEGTSPTKPSPAPAAAPPKAPMMSPAPKPEVITTVPPIFKEISEESPAQVSTANAGPVASGGFRVTRRAKVDNTKRSFHPDLRPRDFLPLHLTRNWTESKVVTVFFNKQSIFVLDDFLRRENTSKIAGSGAVAKDGGWERNEAIPEIGGMLMGQYRLGEDGQTYRVSVEEFIPLKAKTQNVVKVQIDPMSLARDLSTAQDAHPELTVVGWFHTHPGHGLFLSAPDLKVQFGQFREPYNFAMEIDSLTENLDTAFFTYLPSGKMNNRDTRRPDSDWFSWSEIEKFTRRNSPN